MPEREERFIRFLDMVQKERADVLFLMGDIFEFWFGYRNIMFTHQIRVVSKLACLRYSGMRIVYIAGNHDFLPGPALSEYLDFDVAMHPFITQIGRKKVYLSHGDEVNTRDRGYIFMKKITGNPVAQALFKLVPPTWAWRLGRCTSDTSKKLKDFRDRIADEVYQEFFSARSAEGVDVVIHGHTHEAEKKNVNVGERSITFLNSGDWFSDGFFVAYESDGFELKTFK